MNKTHILLKKNHRKNLSQQIIYANSEKCHTSA